MWCKQILTVSEELNTRNIAYTTNSASVWREIVSLALPTGIHRVIIQGGFSVISPGQLFPSRLDEIMLMDCSFIEGIQF